MVLEIHPPQGKAGRGGRWVPHEAEAVAAGEAGTYSPRGAGSLALSDLAPEARDWQAGQEQWIIKCVPALTEAPEA